MRICILQWFVLWLPKSRNMMTILTQRTQNRNIFLFCVGSATKKKTGILLWSTLGPTEVFFFFFDALYLQKYLLWEHHPSPQARGCRCWCVHTKYFYCTGNWWLGVIVSIVRNLNRYGSAPLSLFGCHSKYGGITFPCTYTHQTLNVVIIFLVAAQIKKNYDYSKVIIGEHVPTLMLIHNLPRIAVVMHQRTGHVPYFWWWSEYKLEVSPWESNILCSGRFWPLWKKLHCGRV
jgi:hypothetical protein